MKQTRTEQSSFGTAALRIMALAIAAMLCITLAQTPAEAATGTSNSRQALTTSAQAKTTQKAAKTTSISKGWWAIDSKGKKVTASYAVTYNGKIKNPIVALTNGKKTIKRPAYVPLIKNNKNVGTATVLIKGAKSYGYTGEFTVKFTIKAKPKKVAAKTYGWKCVNSAKKLYQYFDPQTGQQVKGREYYVTMASRTAKDSAPGWRYFDSNGYLRFGWQTVNGARKYYRSSNGVRAQGYWTINNVKYAFNNNGVLLKDHIGNGNYYRASDGVGQEYASCIFDKYNNFRARKGANRVTWDPYCQKLANETAYKCARAGKLAHRLAIPVEQQSTYSDILYYGTSNFATPDNIIRKWENSTGHRKMMQCRNGTTRAAVGYYWDGTKFWVAIVYNFYGCNQSGS